MVGEQKHVSMGDYIWFREAQAWDNRLLYCSCGHPVLVRSVPDGLTEGPHFFSPENYAREISYCPGCGRVLSEVDLTPSLPDEI